MSSNEHILEEGKAMLDSVNENIREIELGIKAGAKEIDQAITTHLTALKKVRLDLRLILDNNNLDQSEATEDLDKYWEVIAKGRKLLKEQKKIFKNR
jgi:hypothetical protein